MTFDSKITFEKHLRSVSIAASQRLGILGKSWRVFHDRSLLGRCFRVFVLPVFGAPFCSLVLGCRYKLLDRAVSGARFEQNGAWFDLVVCLSVTLLIVDPWQSIVCFIRSGVKLCNLLMVL